ncbi:hypothetical protein Q4S45_13150 [Massilia sp. R2A-15]|uniref:hypothetical protein n=1 Tax=Massilia sp. R2A-15 TaxID=3064278 RepID=UPI0027351497|nr:hypothetical protein [Massilia sp. R2A-15]WLI87688.1 hypothetical protein Q4S45_13150 [Massilia sp. R2A-15]
MIECNRKMEQARRDFSLGKLSAAVLIRVPMSRSGWTVRLSGGKGDAGMLLDVKTLEAQVFDTLDGAAQALELIGFRFEQLKLA